MISVLFLLAVANETSFHFFLRLTSALSKVLRSQGLWITVKEKIKCEMYHIIKSSARDVSSRLLKLIDRWNKEVFPRSNRRYKLRFHRGSIAENAPILSSGTVTSKTKHLPTDFTNQEPAFDWNMRVTNKSPRTRATWRPCQVTKQRNLWRAKMFFFEQIFGFITASFFQNCASE